MSNSIFSSVTLKALHSISFRHYKSYKNLESVVPWNDVMVDLTGGIVFYEELFPWEDEQSCGERYTLETTMDVLMEGQTKGFPMTCSTPPVREYRGCHR